MANSPLKQAAGHGGEDARSIGLRPIRNGGLAEQAADQLYAAIIEGRLPLGERLSEVALAHEMGISRGPIREAQRLLERRGLLTFSPRRGFFVRTLSTRQIDDLFRLRQVLETFAVSTAIHRASEAELHRLIEWREHVLLLFGGTVVETAPQQPSLLVEEDLAFHRILCTLSGNESLCQLFDVTLTEIRLALSLINAGFRSAHRLVQSHDPLIDAILARNEAEACRLIAEHLEYSRKRLIEKLEHPAAGKPMALPGQRNSSHKRDSGAALRNDA